MAFFTPQKIEKQLAEIHDAVYRERREIERFKFCEREGVQHPATDTSMLASCDYDDSDWADFRVGDTWGGYDVTAWFRARVTIPESWRSGRVYLRFVVGPRDGGGSTAETMLFVNGEPLQALDVWHEEVWLPPEFFQPGLLPDQQGGEIQIALKAWSGVLEVPPRRRFAQAQLALIDEASEKLYHMTRVLLQAVAQLDEQELRRMVLLKALDESYRCIDFSQPRSPRFYGSVAEALGCLQTHLANLAGAEGDMKPHISALGHAHIDLAWLWRLRHSREKAARTFTTALHLMREYPEYRFTHSSPQLFKFLKEDYPDIFARVKERIVAGQWEVTGGMWVESDVNIPNGESLVRQFLLGQQYLREEFGVTCRLLWLPDVFGYSWALPQIARQSGIDYFLTSKISWNQFNRFPYDTFRWRGIDGTELLTYFITTPSDDDSHHTYNGQLRPQDVKGTWDLYNQKESNHELLTLFGWGDGGGGPTREMLESGRVLKDLPGFPTVRQELAEDFFARLAERLTQPHHWRALPVWDGELYLEYHRGTYTSQAFNKRANRQAEILYHDAEWINTLASVLGASETYPARELHQGWEKLLLNQFHDILPGSSIREVYEDSREDYVHVHEIGARARQSAQEALQGAMGTGSEALIVYNSLSWNRHGIVALPTGSILQETDPEDIEIREAEGGRCPTQFVSENGEQMLLVYVSDAPALGYATYPLEAKRGSRPQAEVQKEIAAAQPPLTIRPDRMENAFLRLTLNEHGQITSIWDKRRQREVLAGLRRMSDEMAPPRGNVLQVFVDRPLKFDAWDIDIFYQDKMHEIDELIAAEVEEEGPLRGVLRLCWRFLDSTITQRITLYAHSPRIDFRTEVDWQERQMLLKVAFPVDVRATRATYDIQFGNIERPTHWNTSWDTARFEVVAQKWADLSEGDYGVALLNDCKYGYDVKDNILRLTLIKSAVRPDAEADRGLHHFTYSLLPHEGDWRDGQVQRQAYDLNYPLHASVLAGGSPGSLPGSYSFAAVDATHVMLETVKQAQDGDGWIIRLYETQQKRRTAVTLTFGSPLARIEACNLLEEAVRDDSLQHDGNKATFAIDPYEIKSFRVWFADA